MYPLGGEDGTSLAHTQIITYETTAHTINKHKTHSNTHYHIRNNNTHNK